jgi:hypothetical protein
MLYSRGVNVKECLIEVYGDSNKREFEPGKVVSFLPDKFPTTDYPIIVTIRDEREIIEYKLEKFLSKSYPIRDNFVIFAGKKFDIRTLSITFGVKVILYNENDDMIEFVD